ncbi:mannosyltransferase family protein [Oryzihumus leptocrescens]|uniref:Mannosyltransferase PIG-V n=1 Tax=Oryzihumus leptocrescens TaxID=297536 RepID=A0A542ZM97_9MICO|nr:mannosyltransferase family protein [Oryzihumus leptocrescens]TQL61504.1 mannosyltransferase PIG-V [Oryzihumus leptocrescens]
MIRSLRDRLLAKPTWVVLLWAWAVSRVVTALVVQATAMWVQEPAGVHSSHPGYLDMVPIWDGTWYREVVAHGYPLPLPLDAFSGQVTFSAWAFYPGFPLLVRLLTAVGIPFTGAALVVNLAAGAAAVLLMWHVLQDGATTVLARRMALLATMLWCLYPATAVLQVAYTEALAVVLLLAFFFLLLRRRYLWASVAVLALGFTRAVAPPVGLVVALHLFLRWRREGRAFLPGQRVSAAVLLVSTAVSAVAWPLMVGVATGRMSAFFEVQAAWGQRPDKGPFVAWLTWAWDHMGVAGVLLLIGIVASYLSLVLGRHGRWLAPEVRAWAVVYPLYLLAVVRPITSMWRFLILDFPLAAIVVSMTVRGADGGHVLDTWPRRLGLVTLALLLGVVVWTVTLLTYTPWADSPP